MHSPKAVPSTSFYPCGGARPARRRQLRTIPPRRCPAPRVSPFPVPWPWGRRRPPLGKRARRVILWDVRGPSAKMSPRECWMERSRPSNASTAVFLASHGPRASFVLLRVFVYACSDVLQMQPLIFLILLR